MSYDVFVQDLPPEARSADEIPDDFVPGPIGTRTQVLAAIQEVAPAADASRPDWILIDGPDFALEVALGEEEELTEFAFHARGGADALAVIAAILTRLGLRALDPQAEGGLFAPGPDAAAAFARWRAYRDRVADRG